MTRKRRPANLCILVASLLLGAVQVLSASPVSSELARVAVERWIARGRPLECPLGGTVSSVRTCTTTNGVAFHVVRLSGGGFVVASADTELEPVIAFSADGDLDEQDRSPLWALLNRDLSRRHGTPLQFALSTSTFLVGPGARWAELTGGMSAEPAVVSRTTVLRLGRTAISDLRVAPLLRTKWAQDAVSEQQGGLCYNFYTPSNYSCGCVATAGAQIMKYHRFPTDSVEPGTYVCNVQSWEEDIGGGYVRIHYAATPLTMQGGIYDWDTMPNVPENGATLSQRRAIGKLTSDLGIACRMEYSAYGSGTGGYMLAPALTERFGYANAVPTVSGGFSQEELASSLLPNLDAGLPALLGVEGWDGGHAIVADGYGYVDSVLYVHCNLGWAGAGDAWYAPPQIDDFDVVNEIVCNIYPTGASGGVICSGRILSTVNGRPLSGVEVVSDNPDAQPRGRCLTDERGIYALILAPGAHTVAATCDDETQVRDVELEACVGAEISGIYYLSDGKVRNLHGCDFAFEAVHAGLSPVVDNPSAPSLYSSAEKTVAEGATAPFASSACVYDGYLWASDGGISGTIQVKVSKGRINGQTGVFEARTTARVQLADGSRKISFAGGLADATGAVTLMSTDGHVLELSLGVDGFGGSLDGAWSLDGVRNLFGARTEADKAVAVDVLNQWRGAINVVADDVVLTAEVANKGRVRLSGTVRGAKVSASSQLLVGASWCCIPVVLTQKAKQAFCIWLPREGGAVSVAGLDVVAAGRAGVLRAGAVFANGIGASVLSAAFVDQTLLPEFLPDGLEVALRGARFVVAGGAKAGKVAFRRGTLDFDAEKLGGNPSALKLAYKAKNGTFRGSYKAYARSGPARDRIRPCSVTVTGVLVDGVGYGTATVRNPACCWSVRLE